MAGRKSSFLMRTKKVKEGERVELTHLESQSTGRFASLDEATSWVRAKWTDWDAKPADKEEMPAGPADGASGMRRLWDNAWTGQGLRRGEALVLAAAVLVVAVIAGDPGVRGAVTEAFGATQLTASSSSGPADLIGFTRIHWTYTGGSAQALSAEIEGAHSGVQGVKALLPAPSGRLRVFCFNLSAAAKVAFAFKSTEAVSSGAGMIYLAALEPSGKFDVPDDQGVNASYDFDCPASYHDAALVHIPSSLQSDWLNTGPTPRSGGTEGRFTIWFYR